MINLIIFFFRGLGVFKNMKESLKQPVEEIVADRIIANTMAWGHDYVSEKNRNMRVLSPGDFGIKSRLNFIVNNNPEKQMVHVFDAEEAKEVFLSFNGVEGNVVFNLEERKVIKESASGLSVLQTLEEGTLLIEYGIGGGELIDVLNQIEDKARTSGLYDEMGNRKRPENMSLAVEKKINVDKAFSHQGTIYPLFGQDPDELKQMFDNPDELILRQDPYTGNDFGFIRKKDLDYFEKHDKIINDVFIEMGITFEELILLLEKDEQLGILVSQEIKKEVDKRMKELEE